MTKPTQGFEFAYSLDATHPWLEPVATTASTTYSKGDLIMLVSGAAVVGTAGWTAPVIGISAEAATVTSSTVPATIRVARVTPAHVFRVQYTGTPNAAVIRGGTVDISNGGTVNAADITVGAGAGLIVDKPLDTSNGWAYVRLKNIYGYGN